MRTRIKKELSRKDIAEKLKMLVESINCLILVVVYLYVVIMVFCNNRRIFCHIKSAVQCMVTVLRSWMVHIKQK